MLWRLFQGLEQAVEGLLRQHVHLVDDVHLVARCVRLVVGAVDQVADVVDAGVRSRIHLHHVEMPALENGAAVLAFLAHVEGGRSFAANRRIVQSASDQPRGGGLAHAAHASEHIGLGDAARGKRIPQRLHHGVLADELGEQPRTVFAGERGMTDVGGRGRTRAVGFRRFLPGALRRALSLVFVFSHGRQDFHAE